MLTKIGKLLFTTVISALMFPALVFAQGSRNEICGVGDPNIPVETFVGKLFGCGVSLIGGVAVLFIIYGGFVLATSSGDPNKVRLGKEYITYAIVGLVLAILTMVLLEVIGADILQIPGFGR